MTKPKNKGRTWSDWLTDKVLRAVIIGTKILPYDQRVPIMGTLTSRLIAPMAGYIKRADKNLAYIYPDMTLQDRQRIARAVANNAGRTIIETYSPKGLMQKAKTSTVSGLGLEALQNAKLQGKPVLLVTGHYGNHEAPRYALTAMGYEIGGLYRPMANQFFNEHYANTMADISGPVFAQGRRGTAGFVKYLKQGGIAVLLFDIYTRKGVTLPFLGKPAPTALSAADLALKYNAILIPFFGKRREDGLTFDIQLDAPIDHTSPEQMLTEMNTRLEKRIHENPEQWFWIHRRWRKKVR
ncbi:lysophospholipid acyltransferase family protein [Parasulfitobacter algicola]|uniref:Lysophospholipid acyltransferase family protein n=1 Tax=Parasulfitobacter algicola TaxID=2614809 RepID=A0ABX2IYV6_9RHOB|nr:lysophospholipid acyltransferase family protein [Sulfitobacter algicola]NSX55463.1 lysophospholipid acyltransferase family protein [Sulfitobacter algicola]